jgi:hypothetical protein
MDFVVRRLAWMLLAFVSLTAVPSEGFPRGKAKVEWTKIEVPESADAARITKLLRGALKDAVKRADFGKVKAVSASAHVIELSFEDKGDVLRISCTIVGRLENGLKARSHISFGGSPTQRRALEKQVLTMVANGVVTRLAELARR